MSFPRYTPLIVCRPNNHLVFCIDLISTIYWESLPSGFSNMDIIFKDSRDIIYLNGGAKGIYRLLSSNAIVSVAEPIRCRNGKSRKFDPPVPFNPGDLFVDVSHIYSNNYVKFPMKFIE